ncbi:MAG: Eco57I restriction-modification methylase domain-containing protein [Prolixibacteraceae bacterium]|nr:Eco57I restriction-modification methylase domain-containing protein [Prolixibacteraceae bacterium]
MALFQKTVEKKYIKQLDSALINAKYQEFKTHFGNTDIQENIRNSKEEQYQGEFLIDLFVKILGYVKNPNPDFNLTTEYKNVKDSKKADGAIIINDSVNAVIELKGTNTTDLSKIETQAFGYKNNQAGCVYVVTSNFEKLRFYIDNAIEHIEFNLFTLSKADFEILYLCLSFESIKNGLPKKVKEESLSQEDVITKKLYQDYSLFKRELHQNLVSLNPQFDSLTLFKKSQKLLDRFLFLFFAEDRHLLPPNSVRLILNDWRDLQEREVEIPLYQRFKKYFEYLNTGFKGKRYDVFAYNGGLFKPDEVLDTILIDDELLFKHTYKLSEYDFVSEVDVNILGHIFENSMNELDEINAQLTGEEIDKTKTRRKKDGVFYTPKYITKYIVENSVGKLCIEKKAELQIVEEEYATDKKRHLKTKQALLNKLKTYQNWLLKLTICDPACGSGAFLNQSLDFLITEHRYIDELQAKLLGVPIIFSDIEKSILENNLFGVDLNEESVEIAKLSLWLRTAQPNRKLNDLNNNIKCGNSLINDPAVAGEKAFNWHEAFPQIFENGGFDVVIGNPPYVQLQSMGEMSEILQNCGYETFDKGADLYCIFTERGYKLLKNGGIQSFIMPNKWMLVAYGKPLRKFLSKTGLRQVLNFGDIQFFQEATTYVCIFVTQKSEPNDNVKVLSLNQKTYHGDFMTEVEGNLYNYPTSKFGEAEWSIQPYNDSRKLEQMKLNSTELKDLPINIYRGILTGYNDAFYIDEKTRQKLIAVDVRSSELIKPMVRGRDISAYEITGYEYLISTFPTLKLDIENYPAIKEHLLSFGYDRLKQTGNSGARKKTSGKWFETQDSISYHEEFAKPKIIYPEITAFFPFMYDNNGILTNQKCFILTAKDDSISLLFLTALFNSSLTKLWIWHNCPELQGGTREIRKVYFEHFPVPQANEEQMATLAQYATERTQLTADLQTLCSKFTRNIQREYNLVKLSAKLENWFQIPFNEFLKELEKSKVKLTLSQKAEWEDYFLQESKKALDIKHQIDTTDKEIDQMVYGLYRLSEEEIAIVENP